MVEPDELLGFMGYERRLGGMGRLVFEKRSMMRRTVFDRDFDCS